MNRSWRAFSLAALLGLAVVVVAQAPAQAQYRRPFAPPPVRPYIPPAPRAFVATPPPVVPYANSYTYLPSGLNLNQAATLNALRIQTQLYNSLYNPYSTYNYPIYSNPTLYNPYYTPGIAYSPYNVYNPYFSAFGLRP